MLPAAVREIVGDRRRRQIGAFVSSVLDAVDRTGEIGMSEPAAEALGEFRAFNFEQIYMRPGRPPAGRAVIRVLGDSWSTSPTHRCRIPDRVRTARSHGPAPGRAAALRVAVHVRDRHDRPLRASVSASSSLGWRPDDVLDGGV